MEGFWKEKEKKEYKIKLKQCLPQIHLFIIQQLFAELYLPSRALCAKECLMITNFGSCGAPILEQEAGNKEVNNKEELLQIVLKKIKS